MVFKLDVRDKNCKKEKLNSFRNPSDGIYSDYLARKRFLRDYYNRMKSINRSKSEEDLEIFNNRYLWILSIKCYGNKLNDVGDETIW